MINVKYIESKKLSCPQEILVTFRYKAEIVNVIRSIPERYWDAKNKEWHLPYDSLYILKERLPNEQFSVEGKPIDNRKYGEKVIDKHYELPVGIKTKLYEHQVAGFNEMMNFDKFLLLDSPGCISGDMIVSVNRCSLTNKYTMRQVYNKWNRLQKKGFNGDFRIRCLLDGYFGLNDVENVVYSGDKEVYELQLEDNYCVQATLDHKILTKEGYKELQDIKIGDKVVCNGEPVCKLCGSNVGVITNKYKKYVGYCKKCMYKLRKAGFQNNNIVRTYDKDGYVILRGAPLRDYLHKCNTREIYEHRYIMEQHLGRLLTDDEVVHHKNGIKDDNRIENLVLCTKQTHMLEHHCVDRLHKDFIHRRSGNLVVMTPKEKCVIGIKYIGVKDTYDIQMKAPYHNFIANGVVVHNCGKSLETIAVALKRKEVNKVKHCLIICGVNSLKFNWKDEIETHTNETATILGMRVNKKGKIEIKSNKDKLDDLDNLKTFFVITNIESLRDANIKEKLIKLVKNNTIEMICVDECHKCSNVTAQQTRALVSIAKDVKYFYGLTGTVLSNSPLDAYIPLKLTGAEKANHTNFKYRYCVMGGFNNYQVVGYKHLDELQSKLNKVSLRRTKEDVLDLPPKTYKVEYVELGTKQRKLYNDVLKTIMDDIDNIMLSPNPLSQLTRLRQVTADSSILSSTIDDSAKFERLDDIIEEQVSNNEKIVVFSNWTTITNKLFSRYKKYNPAMITGEIKDREAQKKKFMEDDSCKVLIGTISAMGTGLTLTAATTAVFVDEPFTFTNYEQAADRIYRIGQSKNVTIISLIAKDTIDERVHKIMIRKKNIAEALVDKKYNLRDKKILEWLLEG